MELLNSILYDTVYHSAPIILCVIGGIFAYKANVLNIALEGMMLNGAFVSVLVEYMTGSVAVAIIAAIVTTLLWGLLFSILGISCKGNVIVIGLGINLIVPAIAKFVLKMMELANISLQNVSVADFKINIPIIQDIPVIGNILSGHPLITYLAFIGIALVAVLMYKTKFGVYVRVVEGQMLLGGFFAGIVGAYLTISNPFLSKVVCFVVAILCGMLFALIPAILKAKCNVNEMVVTLMLNYAMAKTLEFLTTGIFRDKSAGYVATPTVQDAAMFQRIGTSRMTMFFVIAVIILIVMYFLMNKSKLGYEITAIGKNPEFAEATGMNVGRKIIIMMLISGALAGIAGAGWMLSDQFKYTLSFSVNPGLGWDGMLIALLGGHSPIGIFIAAVFYAALKTGSDSINLYTTVPKEIIAIIQGMIILFLAVKFIGNNTKLFDRFKKGKKEAA